MINVYIFKLQRALAVGSTVAPVNKRNRQDYKKSNVRKKIPTDRNAYTKKSSKTTQCSKGQEEVDKNEENAEGVKHECGVCNFECSNYNDFQVRNIMLPVIYLFKIDNI